MQDANTNNFDLNGPDGSLGDDGAWHHFALTVDRDAATALTYFDGAQVATTGISSLGSVDNGSTISIGQDPTGLYPEPGSADLDDLGVWRRVLTPLEVYEIFYSGSHFGAALDAYGPVSLAVTTSGGKALVVWQAGTLLQADTLAGPWTAVPGATAPTFQVSPGTGAKFYRVHL